jgi:mono/diheme cytochrome c family protein
MRSSLVLAASVALAGATGVALAGSTGQDFSQIERGRYLAIVGDCAGCHTKPGGQDFAGGLPVETPFGNVVASNITPAKETGIGLWSDEDFLRAVTEGTRRDGKHLFPAMPYPYFTKMRREDVLAIRAYLTTVPAIHNGIESDQLPFPLSVRADMAAWNKLNFKPGAYQRDPDKGDEWTRGAYLVEGPMHCGACHTPKNLAGGDKDSERFQGYALQGWFAPDLTTDPRRGIGSWSPDDLIAYLKTGHNRFSAATGPMADVVTHSTSKLTDADLHAVATYLTQQPAPDEKSPQSIAAADPAMKVGAAIYADECSACHAPRGDGIANLFPRLAGSPSVQSTDPTSLIRVILAGTQSVATAQAPTAPSMPSFGQTLNDREVAAVLTYIRNAWGNAATAVSADDIAKHRDTLTKRSG